MRSMPGGIIRAADQVVQGDVEIVRQGDEIRECRLSRSVFVSLICHWSHSDSFSYGFLGKVSSVAQLFKAS